MQAQHNPPINGVLDGETDPQSVLNEIIHLIENEIPECKQNLRDNHHNLERVADYCDNNYYRSPNKQAALEETKNFATQSLASVAYQITSLAFNVLHLLDLQTSQMTELESQTNHISLRVDIHKEKVARREIGLFTANKRVNRLHKILVPANPERAIKYVRKPIDYSLLDDVGHGVKLPTVSNTQQQLHQSQMHTSRTRSISSAQSINGANLLYAPTMSISGVSASSAQAPTTKPPTPPQTIRSVGSLSRASKEYRNPALSIAPPQVPSNYAPNFPIGHPRNQETARRESGYSTLPLNHHTSIANAHQNAQQSHYNQQPQVGMVHPLSHASNFGQNSTSEAPLPPPPMPSSPSPAPTDDNQRGSVTGNMSTGFNIYNRNSDTLRYGQSPMPPPPTFEESNDVLNGNSQNSNYTQGTVHNKNNNNEPDWVPKNYIEKVIALYDYTKDKSDELTFFENSVIYVIKKNEDGWYEGVLDGETGLFPCNYVEPCRDYSSN